MRTFCISDRIICILKLEFIVPKIERIETGSFKNYIKQLLLKDKNEGQGIANDKVE